MVCTKKTALSFPHALARVHVVIDTASLRRQMHLLNIAQVPKEWSADQISEFLSEVIIMAAMPNHPNLDQELAAYEKLREQLETRAMGKWVVVHNQELVGTYGSFDDAAKEAVEKFGRGPYLIRQVGAPSITLPASVMYIPVTK